MDGNVILALVNDLLFSVKIGDAAKRAGMKVEFITDSSKLLAKASLKPAAIIFDLNFDRAEPVWLISQLKASDALRSIPLLGYLSHVQVDLKLKAEEAGCDEVVARSVFSRDLPELIARYA
jgi:PleD family two-component response regulator